MEYKKKISLYKLDVEGELNVSPFEYLDTFAIRSELHRSRDQLKQCDLQLIQYCDQQLLNRIEEFYSYIAEIYSFNDSKKPLEEWWWHLDRVVAGELIVELDK
ncbi:hypothetical protein J2W91_004627 [Paenibacillus amylolyticus]|uniref:Uncharacterized protein n=1 Tax=Paenibacillus amylolyticus TaxID=1451 RepID=A0AAP5H8Y9_PAEAM|nr:hypothetical protein [Paenibacillus amylolyticus]MDR6726121.1 hypothetical protein [Paenibacillus amylolyticus]